MMVKNSNLFKPKDWYSKCYAIFLSLVLLIILIFSGCITEKKSVNTDHIIMVDPIDGPVYSLNQALQNAEDHDVIILSPGIYRGDVKINKTVTIRGSSMNKTIIKTNVSSSSPVFFINADHCRFSNLSFIHTNDTLGNDTYSTAIEVLSSDCLFEKISIHGYGTGISIQYYHNNNIRDSMFSDLDQGVEILHGDDNEFVNCSFIDCKTVGVFIGFDASDNRIAQCQFYRNDIGVRIKGAMNNIVYQNNFIDCRNPIHECCGAKDNTLSFNEITDQ